MIHVEQALRRLKAAFPGSSFGPETVVIYAEKLAPYSPAAVARATEQCIELHDRFPSVAQMIEHMNDPAYFEPYKAPLLEWKDTQHGDGCGLGGTLQTGILKGQAWEPWEIQGKNGQRGFPNSVYFRALAASKADMESRLISNAQANRKEQTQS